MLKQNFLVRLFPLIFLSLFLGCAHRPVETRLNQKLAQDVGTMSQDDFMSETEEMIEQSDRLSPNQKTALQDLRISASDELKTLASESLKLRKELLQDLLAPTLDKREIAVIKRRLDQNSKRRVAVLYTWLDKAGAVLGRDFKVRPDREREPVTH